MMIPIIVDNRVTASRQVLLGTSCVSRACVSCVSVMRACVHVVSEIYCHACMVDLHEKVQQRLQQVDTHRVSQGKKQRINQRRYAIDSGYIWSVRECGESGRGAATPC